jgi:hypothetical protein
MKYWFQNDFSGGENSAVQSDSIGDGQVAELYNMLPRRTADGVHARTALTTLTTAPSKVRAIFKKKLTDGTVHTIAALEVTGTPNTIKVRNLTTNTDIIASLGNASAFDSMWFVDWDGNKTLMSDGVNGLYVYNGTGTATLVYDQTNVATTKPKATSNTYPGGKYLTQHNGRLFMAGYSGNGSFCTVHVCGSDDGTVARYESWSGLSQSNGGSIDVVPYGTKVTGLASSYGGVVIFKENSIHLWSYPDSAAPWDASKGSSVDVLYSGVGCLSHDSIVESDSGVLFMGIAEGRNIGLYGIDGSNVSRLSDAIPRVMKSVLATGTHAAQAEMVDGYYVLSAKNVSTGKIVTTAIYDTTLNSWATFGGTEITCVYKHPGDDYVMFGGVDGTVYRYPSTTYTDPDGLPVFFRITTRRHVEGNSASDVYYRLVRVSGGALTPTTISVRLLGARGENKELPNVDFSSGSSDLWSDVSWDGQVWNAADGSIWEMSYHYDDYTTEADFRTRGAQLEISGYAAADTYVDYLALGYRPRKTLNAHA